MTARDRQYLAAHNKRRREWHTRYDKEYVPLKWSKGKLVSLELSIVPSCLAMSNHTSVSRLHIRSQGFFHGMGREDT